MGQGRAGGVLLLVGHVEEQVLILVLLVDGRQRVPAQCDDLTREGSKDLRGWREDLEALAVLLALNKDPECLLLHELDALADDVGELRDCNNAM